MAINRNLEVTFGSSRMAVDTDKITGKTVKQIYKALTDIKKSHNPLVKYPRIQVKQEDGSEREETFDEWRDRVLTAYADQLDKREDESDEDYEQRITSLALTDHELTIAYEFVNAIAKIFSLPEVSQDMFDSASVEKVFNFCYDMLSIGRIQDQDQLFSPALRSSDRNR